MIPEIKKHLPTRQAGIPAIKFKTEISVICFEIAVIIESVSEVISTNP